MSDETVKHAELEITGKDNANLAPTGRRLDFLKVTYCCQNHC